jgi:uncharacterized SAM-binding protein YcdF (DUF218 family)
MLFIASKLLSIVFEPGNFLLLLLMLGLWRLAATRRRRGMLLVGFAAWAYLLIAVLPLAQWAIAPLENRFPSPRELPAQVDGIVMLGGAVIPSLTLAHGQAALNEAGERVTETFVLAQRYPAARVVLAGGNGEIHPSGISEAAATSDLLVAMGLDAKRLILEERSRTTYENAIYAKPLADPKPGETWLLVTSAYHMPRAIGCFRQVGWETVAYPVDYQSGDGWRLDAFALADNLMVLKRAAHEWSGLAIYYLTGRIDTLYPGPRSASSDR